jgi:serine protease
MTRPTRQPPRQASFAALALCACCAIALGLPATADARASKSATTLRVMLNPAAAPRGTLPDAVRDRLSTLAGAPVALVGTTRTGALELAVGGPRDDARLEAMASRLRSDRTVLWVEAGAQRTVAPKSANAAAANRVAGRKLLVRLADGVDPTAVAPRLAQIAGVPVTIERAIGNVQVVALAQTTTVAALDAIARKLEQDPSVRYADAVRRARPAAAPNDPLYAQQWSLPAIGAEAAWAQGAGSPDVTVAVIDTGILPHPDLAGRLLPGYDFISDAGNARDGDGRDSNPRDEGDWLDDGDCGGFPSTPSFFHGLFVAGQIAANTNNGEGIAGLDRAAKILPVRVLGRCGGTFEDVLEGMLWASGVPIGGVPPNPNPAKVINMSLGGFGSCAAAIQEAVDEALAQGTVVVVSAGNESDDAMNYAPGNCSGVINVGALSRGGDRASYSNWGRRVDVSAPGGDIDADGQVLSTHYTGSTTPGEPTYELAIGTSFAAPLVSGTLSQMLARNPNLTPGQALSIVQGTSRDFPAGSPCAVGGFCGIGMLDAGLAVQSTIPASANPPPGTSAVVEYYDTTLDHYLITSDPFEIASLDADWLRWRRTGHVFYAWTEPAYAPADVFPQPVCRFYAGPAQQIDSHWFSADPVECNTVLAQSPGWQLQTSAAFFVEMPDFAGQCRAGTLPVYRFFNNRRDANQRHTVDLSVKRAMINRAWVPDGKGANGAAFCSPY